MEFLCFPLKDKWLITRDKKKQYKEKGKRSAFFNLQLEKKSKEKRKNAFYTKNEKKKKTTAIYTKNLRYRHIYWSYKKTSVIQLRSSSLFFHLFLHKIFDSLYLLIIVSFIYKINPIITILKNE